MSLSPPNLERLQELTTELQLNNGSLPEAETKELEAILSADEQAREWFILTQELHTMLETDKSIRLQLAADLLPDNVVAMPGVEPVVESVVSEVNEEASEKSRSRRKKANAGFRMGTSFAAMFVGLLGLLWMYAKVADFSGIADSEDPSKNGKNLARAEKVSFHDDVLPILTDHCFACHGEEESSRKAKLRLDTPKGPVHREDPVIIPGNSQDSLLIARISSTDPEYFMPPEDSGKPHLNADQIEILTKWVDQGANYGQKWSQIPLKDSEKEWLLTLLNHQKAQDF